MAYNWQQSAAAVHGSPQQALLDVQQQQQQQQQQHHSQQQQQRQMMPMQHHTSFYGPNPGGAMPGAMPGPMMQGQPPSNADIEAIWSNYQPNKISTSFSNGGIMPQQSHFIHNQETMTASNINNFTPMSAAAAAAAYSQLGFPQQPGGVPGNDRMGRSQWGNENAQPQQSGLAANSLPPRAAKLLSSTVGYDGDASNSSSTQTPGASSGDDSNEKKQRQSASAIAEIQRLTSGPVFAQQHQQQQHLNGGDQSNASNVSTRRGSLNFNNGLTADAAAGQRPSLRHRRSHSGSQVPMSTGSFQSQESGGGLTMAKRMSGPAPTFHHQHYSSSISSMTPYASSLAGHAASHPPGLGGHLNRGVDAGAGGIHAATDFTKRKGWYNRIVDELLDFVHVLDSQGRILYAASSVGSLTGWKLEELRGRKISSLIHPDDSAAFMIELQRCFRERSEMTTYYRFRKKPQTAADKQRVRDQRAASNTGQSNSYSTSEGDSSSNQDNNRPLSSTKFGDGLPEDNIDPPYDDDADLNDDHEDRFVLFEVTGHPYVAPNEGDEPAGAKTENSPTKSLSRSKGDGLGQLKGRKSSDSVATTAAAASGGADGKGDGVKKAVAAGEIPKDVQCFFCSGRVYPTKTVGMLDSFLEYKLENERLRMLLSELSVNDGTNANAGDNSSDGRRSLDAYPIDYPKDLDGQANSVGHGAASLGSVETVEPQTNGNVAADQRRKSSNVTAAGDDVGLSSPISPRATNLNNLPAAGTADSTYDSDENNEYSDDNMSPSLGLDDDAKPKKKKPKAEEGDYVCTDCGRVDSPEWRKGPLGPKTLCNACGLRWAKKVKRSGLDPNAVSKAGAAAKAAAAAAAAAGGDGARKMSSQGSQGQPMQGQSLPVSLMQQQSAGSNNFGSATSRPPMGGAANPSGSMYGQMPSFGQMGSTAQPQPPPQDMYGPHMMAQQNMYVFPAGAGNQGGDPYGGGGGGNNGGNPGMVPLIHHGGNFMSQPSQGMAFANQQHHQPGAGGPAMNQNMLAAAVAANNAGMYSNMHGSMPDYNQIG